MSSRYLTDPDGGSPRLEVYLNLDNLADAPAGADWPAAELAAGWDRLRRDGFQGVQLTAGLPPASPPLPYCGLDRINLPEEAEPVMARHAARGDNCISLHVGWGIESDQEMDLLVEAILTASERHHLPVFIETHRATITQDMWRTVELTRRIPEVRFNGDFSHYYCGQEMVYGGLQMKLDFMEPIFERVGFLHGRIASPGHIQAPLGPKGESLRAGISTDYAADFREIWTRAMAGFLRKADPGAVLIFAPELLSPRYDYASLLPDGKGGWREESDRYAQALRYRDLARECFAAARTRLST